MTTKEKYITTSITAYGRKAMRLYANEVNLDRATPDLVDGLKPVHRRILWSLSQLAKNDFTKTARVVGDVMGRFHPHGDASIADAVTTMVRHCTPMAVGKGNWGNLIADAAAMRYTNCRLSFFGATGFHPDYANKSVTTFVPNYDGEDVEPVSIAFPLPVVLLNGDLGIGVGAACNMPAFTPESVAEVCKKLLAGEKLQPEDFAKIMKPAMRWGGALVKSKENRAAWSKLFTSSKSSIQFEADLEVDTLKKSIIIGEWPDGLNPVTFVERVRAMPETQEVFTSKGSLTFTIQMKKGYNSVQFDTYLKKIQTLTRVKSSYNINVTHRTVTEVDGVIDYDVKLLNLTVPQLVVMWLRERIATEIRSLNYRIEKQQAAIAYSKLMIFASTKIEVITKIVKESKDPKTQLSKTLKITLDQAEQILELKLRQLSRLDQDAIKAKLKEQEAFLATLQRILKAPKKKVSADIDKALEAIVSDRKYAEKISKEKLTLK